MSTNLALAQQSVSLPRLELLLSAKKCVYKNCYIDQKSANDGLYLPYDCTQVPPINMNARLYDPVIGRFASADSIIPDLTTPLDYNRYAYVRGNPVTSRDPTGHFIDPVIGAVFFYGATLYGDSPTWQAFGQVGLSIALMGADFGLGGGGNAAAFKAGVTNLTVSFMQTGRIGKEALEGAAFAALSAGVTDNVANGWINENLHIGDDFARLTAAHMVTQGLIAELRGDKFIHGAVSALGSKLSTLVSGELVGNNTFNNKYGRSSVAAVFGGAFAEATGGDFTQGAVTAAIVHLYNAESGRNDRSKNAWRQRKGSEVFGKGRAMYLDKNGELIEDNGTAHRYASGIGWQAYDGPLKGVYPETFIGAGRALVSGAYAGIRGAL